MGRTIPSFRIAVVLEEKKWKEFRNYLRNKDEKKIFTQMFSIANLYNSASSNAVNPIRIYPIMMSIVLHHYKALKEKNLIIDKDCTTTADFKKDINNTLLLKKEIEKWNNYFFVLRKQNRLLFEEMLQTSYKYSDAINAKGEQYSTESLLLSLIFDQHKLINNNNK